MRIYLVGFMGSGKTTLGGVVAEKLHVPFIDTDALIEASEQMTIQDIFAEKGELHFRELESQVLEGTLLFPTALIATGGGLPCFNDNMARMCYEGITIYLEWSWEKLQGMLQQDDKDRPLLAEARAESDWLPVEQLFFARKSYYEQSAMTIEMSGVLDDDMALLEKACNYIWK